jgi:hypothetical protein
MVQNAIFGRLDVHLPFSRLARPIASRILKSKHRLDEQDFIAVNPAGLGDLPHPMPTGVEK